MPAVMLSHLWDVIFILSQVLVPIGEAVHTIAMPLAFVVVTYVVAVIRTLQKHNAFFDSRVPLSTPSHSLEPCAQLHGC